MVTSLSTNILNTLLRICQCFKCANRVSVELLVASQSSKLTSMDCNSGVNGWKPDMATFFQRLFLPSSCSSRIVVIQSMTKI